MLIVEDRRAHEECGGDILDSPQVQANAELFASAGVRDIDTSSEILCVLQGEVAAATPGDGPVGLGSDSATTCHIVALRHPATGRTCLAHLDDPRGVDEAIGRMLRLMHVGGREKEGEEPLDLYIVGGYLGKSCSQELSTALLSALHSSTRCFRVVLACMARLNSKSAVPAASGLVDKDGSAGATHPALPPPPENRDASVKARGGNRRDIFEGRTQQDGDGNKGGEGGSGAPTRRADGRAVLSEAERRNQTAPSDTGGAKWLPRKTGLAIELSSGRAFPVRFEGEGRGPAWEVRSSRIFDGSREKALTEIYESRSDSVVVSPFPVYVDPRWLFNMLVLTDRDLLAQTSTSPEAEDERFVGDIRAQFSFMLAKCGARGQDWLPNVFGPRQGEPLVFPRAA
ncbi:unnamed protein product, partial [Scytosiphon promiscuus]